jgi:hypothetical protein
MAELSLARRGFYRYLGLAYAFAYWSGQKSFLGATIRGWLKFMALGLVLASFVGRWGGTMTVLAVTVLVWLHFSYWRAHKAGYSKFLPDESPLLPDDEGRGLRPYERIPLRATGIFSATYHNEFVLLCPAEYWLVPLGRQVVMVEHRRQQYLYQFFTAENVLAVQMGWLVVGPRPLPTLAVRFNSTWGKNDGSNGAARPVNLTVYLSFPDEMGMTAVWHTLMNLTA